MSDNRLDKLGDYFLYHEIKEKYRISFERFLYLVEKDLWKEWVG
jgi:hypothetical protein